MVDDSLHTVVGIFEEQAIAALVVRFHRRVFGSAGNCDEQICDNVAQVVSVASARIGDNAKVGLQLGDRSRQSN